MVYLQADIGIACGDTRLQLDLLPMCLNSKAVALRDSEDARDNAAQLSNVITSSEAAMRHFSEDGVRSPAAHLPARNQKPPSLSVSPHLS